MTHESAFPQFEPNEALGTVESVDTNSIVLKVTVPDKLQRLKVNRLVALQVDAPQQFLIGIVERIRRTAIAASEELADNDSGADLPLSDNIVRIGLVGTFKLREGEDRNVFKRSLDRVPDIGNLAFPLEQQNLTLFMTSISRDDGLNARLRLGRYTIDAEAIAYLNGNRFFQRHAVIVGSTGSGKSNATAHILEQVAQLPTGNALVFDVHGEYGPIEQDPNVVRYRVAAPGDKGVGLEHGVVFLPFWLLRFEALLALIVERSDSSAVNQASVLRDAVMEAKISYLKEEGRHDLADEITVDSAVPFDLASVIAVLKAKDTEREAGARAGVDRAGQYNGKLTRMIGRIESKIADRRLSYMFAPPTESYDLGWLTKLALHLTSNDETRIGRRRVRILDLSEVPSETLPLTVGIVAELVFQLHQWAADPGQPIALFCDEAHLYMPLSQGQDQSELLSLSTFERIAKEGRKYGIGLVIISQRPSELNRTVLSQCNNYIALRLLNADDQNTIKRLLPDNLGGYGELLAALDTGEALVVGDASLLPSRVRMDRPKHPPRSTSFEFWNIWNEDKPPMNVQVAVEAWRRQSGAATETGVNPGRAGADPGAAK